MPIKLFCVCLLGLPFSILAEPEIAFDYALLFNKHQATPAKVKFCEPQDNFALLLDATQKAVALCGGFTLEMHGLLGTYQGHGDTYSVQFIALELQVAGKTYRTKFSPDQIPSFLNGVFYGDFNADGKPDFAVKLHDHGVGLAASFGDLLFILSDKQGYRTVLLHQAVTEMALHFVRLHGDKEVTLLLPWYRSVDKELTNDHKAHNFFDFNLLQFCIACDSGVRLANERDVRFPYRVQYTLHEQHDQTKLLTRKQQKELAGDALKGVEFGRLN